MTISHEPLYLVRRTKIPHTFEVAKFDDDDLSSEFPSAVYTVVYNPQRNIHNCSCQGYWRSPSADHKHIRVVEGFCQLDEPWFTWLRFKADGNLEYRTFCRVSKPEDIIASIGKLAHQAHSAPKAKARPQPRRKK